jgi:hypothetical protein
MPQASKTPVARKKTAATTNATKNSLVKCELDLDRGRWLRPGRCQRFFISEEAEFPQMDFEIETSNSGPYAWSWEIQWVVKACPQKQGRNRFKARNAKTFRKAGSFSGNERSWRADLGAVVGGDLVVTVKAGADTFVRRVQICAKEPGEAKINAHVDTYAASHPDESSIAKKIIRQESRYRQFYSDDMPLVSFDNGYGLGQATNPVPSYEQVWNWKAHVKYMIEVVIKGKRAAAKKYLDTHGRYTNEQLDIETLVYYNGANAHYYIWSEQQGRWTVNDHVLCDPLQSNTGWDMTKAANQGKTLPDLRAGKGSKPKYTGRCYAEHIENNQ